MENTEIGKILKKLRIDANETQMDMANKLGISSAYLSSIESGNRTMPITLAVDITNKYNVSNSVCDELLIAYFNSIGEIRLQTTVRDSKVSSGEMDVLYTMLMTKMSDGVKRILWSILNYLNEQY